MPRPRRLTIDTTQGFNCSYVQKVAYARAAEIAGEESPSTMIRRVLDDHCRRVMGEAEWNALAAAGSAEHRQGLLAAFLQDRPADRMAQAMRLSSEGNLPDFVRAEMTHYVKEFEELRDRRDFEVGLRVALHEAVNILQKIALLMARAPSARGISDALELARRLPAPLKDDIASGVIALSRTS